MLVREFLLGRQCGNFFTKNLLPREGRLQNEIVQKGIEPSRTCLTCWHDDRCACLEDEWHVFFTCPLYADLRTRLPFRGEDVVVEGFVTQGDGCTPRNLQALARAILNTPNYDKVVDFLTQVMKRRRQNRHTYKAFSATPSPSDEASTTHATLFGIPFMRGELGAISRPERPNEN